MINGDGHTDRRTQKHNSFSLQLTWRYGGKKNTEGNSGLFWYAKDDLTWDTDMRQQSTNTFF